MSLKFPDMKPSIISEILSSLLILLFVYTAINKLAHLGAFEEVLSKSPVLSIASGLVSILIPVMEVVIAGLLFFPRTKRIGFQLSFALMSVFTIYIAAMLAFASKLPCSCGGVLSELTWKQHLFFNLFFVLVAAWGIRLTRKSFQSVKHMSPQ